MVFYTSPSSSSQGCTLSAGRLQKAHHSIDSIVRVVHAAGIVVMAGGTLHGAEVVLELDAKNRPSATQRNCLV